MGVVIVILLNVLIAQLSYTYSEAKKIAKLQYAANLIKIVTRIEYSRFKCLVGIVIATNKFSFLFRNLLLLEFKRFLI